jgi:hypothetical protein
MDRDKMIFNFSFLALDKDFYGDKQALQQQHPRKLAPNHLLKAVFDYFMTTKTLSVFLARSKDLVRLSTCAQFCAPFRCQLQRLTIRQATLSQGLLKHMASGGFADVTSIEFSTKSDTFNWHFPLSEHSKRLLRAASDALLSLTSFKADAPAFQILENMSPAARARLRELVFVLPAAPQSSIGSVLECSHQLHILRLSTFASDGNLPQALAHAFEIGCLNNLHTLELDLMYAQAALRAILPPIQQGHASSLETLRLRARLDDEHIDVLEKFFPLLCVLDLIGIRYSGIRFSESGRARLLQTAEKHAGLTLVVKNDH